MSLKGLSDKPLSDAQLRRSLYATAWMMLLLPPFLGGTVMSLTGFIPFPEWYAVFTAHTGVYLALVTTAVMAVIPSIHRRLVAVAGLPRDEARVRARRLFSRVPWIILIGVTLYSILGAAVSDVALVSLGLVDSLTPTDHLLHHLGLIPVVMIVSLPVFFYFADRLGRYFGPRGVDAVAIPLSAKVLMLGLLTPLLIDSLLIGYFYNRTGYFALETLVLWFSLLLVAAAGTWLAWRSLRQGLLPLERYVTGDPANAGTVEPPVPLSLDELGVLTDRVGALARREAELATELRRERDFARHLLDGAPVIVLLLDGNGIVNYVNRYFEELTGYGRDDVVGLDWFERFVPARERERVRTRFRRALEESPTRGSVNPVVTRNGNEVEIECCDAVIHRSDDQEVNLLVIGQRVTESSRLERQLREREQHYQALLETIPYGVQEHDLEGTITYSNPAHARLFGYEPGELLGRKFCELMVEPSTGWWRDYFMRAVRERPEPCTLRGTIATREGGPKEVEIAWNYRFDGWGQLSGFLCVIIDVTEQVQSERLLRQSEARLSEAQRLAKLGSWELDLRKDQLLWSDEVYRLFEVDPDEFGASYEAFLGFVHPDDRAMVDEAYKQSLVTQEPYEVVHRLQMADGRIKHVRETGESEFDADGNPVRSVGTVQDITEQSRIERELREFRASLDQAGDFVFVVDAASLRFAYVNAGATRILGYSGEELLGMHPYDIDLENDREGVREQTRSLRNGEISTLEFETVHRHREGHPVPMEVSVQYIEGPPARFVGVARDISERKRAEEELQRMATIVHNAPDFIGISDLDGRALYLNPAGRALVGIRDDAHFHRTRVPDYFPDADRDRVVSEILPEARESGRWQGEIRFRHFGSGAAIPVWFDLFRVDDPNTGQPINFATVTRDITERKRADEELERYRTQLETLVAERTAELEASRQEAERANAAKSEFLSRMSHELRTPLNAVVGFGQLLASEDSLTAGQRENVGEIVSAGQHLVELVDEVLDLSRIESGHLEVELGTVTLGPLLETCLSQVRGQAEARNVMLEWDGTSSTVRADATRLRQVLLNLLSNAIKYNREGGRVRVVCGTDAGGRVRVSVSDTGPGIAPELQPRLFRPFERLESSYSGVEGTGIGLSLAKRLVEAMGGEIGVDSEPGTGSTFWFELASAGSGPRAG